MRDVSALPVYQNQQVFTKMNGVLMKMNGGVFTKINIH